MLLLFIFFCSPSAFAIYLGLAPSVRLLPFTLGLRLRSGFCHLPWACAFGPAFAIYLGLAPSVLAVAFGCQKKLENLLPLSVSVLL